MARGRGHGAALLAGASGPSEVRAGELARAARILEVRSRREVGGAFVGGYRSAFRGVGIEFEESRPYVPGDDVRFLDGAVMARTGVPYVKRFREERDQTVHLAVDVSASMSFGSRGEIARTKGALAARVASLLTVAAMRAGDRVGFHAFDEVVRDELRPGRSKGQVGDLLRRLTQAAGAPGGATGLGASLARVRASARRRSLVFVLSDFRDDRFFAPDGEGPPPRAEWVALARQHDLVAFLIHDPREDVLPAGGSFWLADPEEPSRRLWLRAGRRRVRERYRTASEVRRRSVLRRLRADGASVLPLSTDRDPLPALTRFLAERCGATRRGRP